MSRRGQWRKRKHHDLVEEKDREFGIAATLSHLNDNNESKSTANGEHIQAGSADDDGGEEWQIAESRSAKRRKKLTKQVGDNYPSITHSPHLRLQSYVKLPDLQNLALYLLADGSGPQWCSVRHRVNIRKVVVLMVPGLEMGMFDGKIPLSTTTAEADEQSDKHGADSSEIEQKNANIRSQDALHTFDHIEASPSAKPQPTPDDYYPKRLTPDDLPEALQPLADMFDYVWPIKTPGDDKYFKMHSPMAAMLTAPIAKTKEEKRAKGPQPPRENKDWKNTRTPITEFIASTAELIGEGYVLHPAHYAGSSTADEEIARRIATQTTAADGWVDSPGLSCLSDGEVSEKQIEQGSILRGRQVLTMDCEMCVTSPPGTTPQVFSLTRISIINWDGEVIMDEFVKPDKEITDYLTPYSGITPEKLAGVTIGLCDIQERLINDILTPQTILVGHSLNSDLNALQLTHPYIVDTSLIFPHPRGPPLKSSLKWLAQRYLGREIQRGHGATGHDSIEDARACLDLVKQKCEKGKAWGTSEASGESIFKRLGRHVRPKRDKVNIVGDDEPRLGAVVDWGEPSRGYGAQARVALGCETDEDVVRNVQRALTGDDNTDNPTTPPDGKNPAVPQGGVDFIFARMRSLEAYRGWWTRSKTADNDALRDSSTSASASAQSLAEIVGATATHIREIYDALPPCSALIVYSGSGDPRSLSEMQALHQRFREEYRVKKWDELSVRWTDVEEQKLRAACRAARLGIGFIGVK